jgi:hypothetical protein
MANILFLFLSFFSFIQWLAPNFSFLNMTALHYIVFTKAVYSQSSNLLLVDKCTAYTVVALYFRTKLLKEDSYTLMGCVALHNKAF